MSIDSSLIMRKASLPTVQELTDALAETGADVRFPPHFVLNRSADGWTTLTVDGDETGFEYGVYPLDRAADGEHPEGAEAWGDIELCFTARGALSAETVTLIQQVLGRRWRAALLIEGELEPPEADWGPGASLAALHVDNYGRLKQRAADLEAQISEALASNGAVLQPRQAGAQGQHRRFLDRHGPSVTGWVLAAIVLAALIYFNP